MPVISPDPVDLSQFLEDPNHRDSCKLVMKQLRSHSFVVVRDPRVNASHNDDYIDMMRRYFAQEDSVLLKDERPQDNYQVGIMRPDVEFPDLSFLEMLRLMPQDDWPTLPQRDSSGEITRDKKWRFFIYFTRKRSQDSIGKVAVIPEGFPEWQEKSAAWGNAMLASINTVAEMVAISYGLPPSTFTEFLDGADHLLSPNANDLRVEPAEGAIFNGMHTDLNFATAHGKSNIGKMVHVWTHHNGRYRKCSIMIPDGCILIQVGEQWEWLTGGHLRAGYHEVVYNSSAAKECQRIKDLYPDDPTRLIRISSTVFGTCENSKILKPLPPITALLDQSEKSLAQLKYPPIQVLRQVLNKLEKIGMKRD